jgi:predicted nucleic acid-binding protein
MSSAVDTNILLDILIPDEPHHDASVRLLTEARRDGSLLMSEPVYAELAGWFTVQADLEQFLADMQLQLVGSGLGVLYHAGSAWRAYTRRRPEALVCSQCGSAQAISCSRCGAAIRSRQHIVADFIIGAHALVHAGRLLTRDKGFYRTYFPELVLA